MIDKKPVCFIIPYFGKLPEMFYFWAESCRKNSFFFDFLLVTDSCIGFYPPPVG